MAERLRELKKMAEKGQQIQVKDDFSYTSPKDGKTYTLTLKEKIFSEAYLEFGGNGVQAVFKAGYKVKNALVASAIAYENLRKPNIIAYVDSLLEQYGFNDDNVEKQHLFLLNQFGDLKTKAKAIEMFYRLQGKFKDKDSDGDPRSVFTLILAQITNGTPPIVRVNSEPVPGSEGANSQPQQQVLETEQSILDQR